MTKDFWKAAIMRMLHTVAQTAIAAIGTAAVLEDVNWLYVLSATAVAGVLSLLKSIAFGMPEVQPAVEPDILEEAGDQDELSE
jgi:hypothetical protein